MSKMNSARTPWWKNKVVWIVIAAILIIGGIGNALDGGSSNQSHQSIPAPVPTAEDTPESTHSTEEEQPPATTGGLEEDWAMTACDLYGKAQFPYGYKAHWILGSLANELDIENDKWYFKFTADVTNEFNATRETTVECHVTGSNDAPQIIEFLVY